MLTKTKLYGICKEFGKCICGLCHKITPDTDRGEPNYYEAPDYSGAPGKRKSRIPEFCRLEINHNRIGWYTK